MYTVPQVRLYSVRDKTQDRDLYSYSSLVQYHKLCVGTVPDSVYLKALADGLLGNRVNSRKFVPAEERHGTLQALPGPGARNPPAHAGSPQGLIAARSILGISLPVMVCILEVRRLILVP